MRSKNLGPVGIGDPTGLEIDRLKQKDHNTGSSSNPLLQAALKYAQQGWPVLPLHTPEPGGKCSCRDHKKQCYQRNSQGKHPRTMNGLKQATTDPATIQAWWEMWPQANIGIMMGEQAGMFALDVDPRHDGDESLANLQVENGPLPETMTQRSGSGGKHFVFKYVPGLSNSSGKLGEGLDIKTDGGYIVAAPSIHSSGGTYEWMPGDEISEAPAWLIRKLRQAKTTPTPAADGSSTIPEGQRHTTLLAAGGKMRRQGFTGAEINAALTVMNKDRCNPPLDISEVEEIARSLEKYDSAETLGTNQDRDEPIRLSKSWAEFEAETFEEGEIIAFGLERGEVGLMVSLPDAGKTTITMNAALSLCMGRRFGTITEGGKARRVLYIDGETRRARLQRDIKRMAFTFSPDSKNQLRDQLSIICECEIEAQSLSLTNDKHFLALSADAIAVKPDLIVIDTLASLCPLFNENDNAEQSRKIWRPLQKLARDSDAAVLVIHHVGKRSEDSQTPEAVYRGRGASASGAFARAVWILTPDINIPGLVTLSCKKMKGQKPPDIRFQLNPDTRWFAETTPPPPTKSSLQQVVETVNGTKSVSEIAAALPDLSRATVEKKLAEAVSAGFLEKMVRGRYRRPDNSVISADSVSHSITDAGESTEPHSVNSLSLIGDTDITERSKAKNIKGLSVSVNSAAHMAITEFTDSDIDGPDWEEV